jgi:hypothetical protein
MRTFFPIGKPPPKCPPMPHVAVASYLVSGSPVDLTLNVRFS